MSNAKIKELLKQVQNQDKKLEYLRLKVMGVEGMLQSLCDHLKIKPVFDEPLVPFTVDGESVPVSEA